MKIEIKTIIVVTGSGADNVLLDTTLPNGVWPFTGNASMTLRVARNYGEQYVKDNFPGVPYRVI
mgnify:CR=1 FL=1